MRGKILANILTALTGTLAFSLTLSAPVQAASISYTAVNIAGNQWRVDYTVENDSLSVDLEWFTVYFDSALASNLSVAASPPGWDSLVAQPEPDNGLDGFFDSLALVGLAPGASLGGFAVLFDWLGAAAPGAQSVEVLDPDTFEVLETGRTTNPNTVVPEPASLFLLLAGLIGLVLARCPQSRTTKSGNALRRFSA